MADVVRAQYAASAAEPAEAANTLVLGVTHSQTCLVLGPRLKAFQRAGFRVTLVASPGELLDRTAAEHGVAAAAIAMKRGMAPLPDLVSLIKIWRLLGRVRPRTVEFGTPKASLLGLLAAVLSGVPHRVYLLRGLRMETEIGWKRRLLRVVEQLTCACAQIVLCNSRSLREKAVALRLAPAGKLRVLGEGSSIGVDLDRFLPGESRVREQLGWDGGDRVVGFVGRLTRDKGLPELLDAFERILKDEPGARLLLVGWFDASEDALDQRLRARIEKHPRIHCTGMVKDTAPYYRAMDVMVLPTWREGLPNVVLEAQASGVPVVTTLATGARDSVVPEVTGLLIPPGYPEAIVEAVTKLLRDPERRRKMGTAARAWVREHYVEERVAALTVEFYRGLLEPGHRTGRQKAARMRAALSSPPTAGT